MKHKLLNKLLFLTLLIMGGAFLNPAWGDDYELYSGALTEGDYIIVYNSGSSHKAMNTTVNSGRLGYTSLTPTNDVITTTNAAIVWHVAQSGEYWTIYNAGENKYAASTGKANKAQLLASGTDDQSLWTVSGTSTYEFVNKENTAQKVNANLRNNGTYGFACYSTSTGGALSLYKKKSIVATALSVKTVPTKLNYKVGETLDLTGLVLSATVGGTPTDVTSGYTASPANGATLDEVGAQTVTFTYGGQTTTQTIHVGALESIAITTAPTKTTYDEGQTFDPTGMVVEATFSDGEATPTEWTEEVDDYTYSPSTALSTSDTEITVSYEWDDVEETTTQDITVNAGVPYTVTFNAGTGSCGTSSLTEASFAAGVTLPTATIGVPGWSFAGWATAPTTNTEDEPILYAAGDTYYPTEDCTLYAVYKFSEVSATTYKRATSVSDITSASSVVIVNGTTVMNVTNSDIGKDTAPTETSSLITAPANAVFTLSGNNSDGFTLTNTATLGATGNNAVVSLTTDNNLWTFATSTNGTNNFVLLNKAWTNNGLQYYSGNFKVYTNASYASQANFAMKMYVPLATTVYNSNPAAIVNPTIAWTTAGDKTLYIKNTNTYDNPANVTGIAKTATYESSDATVATVSAAGMVTALKAGSTTITAKVAKEVGVNTEASVSYEVTVKDASNIAGIKAITDASSVVSFTADLTDAVVTYVSGSHAYIQDASGAVYASCGSSLTAGEKINGAVSGSIKASYKIDEITAINLEDATVTDDGVIPSALSKTVAQLIASGTSLEGQLVQVSGATVTASLESGNTGGGKISDDSKVSEINLYAPASNIEALKDAEGTFEGFISYYNASTYRFNIYEQSQITLTKNAPTDQPLTFASDAVEFDEDTDDYDNFTGQTVSGAQGTVTYSVDSDDDGVVTSINASTGVVVLSGECGTATIKASAAAKEVTVAGVTTPYNATTKTYTITVYPRYTVTFNVNGTEIAVREASHGAGVAVPETPTLPLYTFVGWNTDAVVTATDTEPAGLTDLDATIYPEDNDDVYYAVYAVAEVGDDVASDLYTNSGSTGTDATSGITASGNINANNGAPTGGNCFGLTSLSNKTITFTNIDLSSVKSAKLNFKYKLAKSGSYYSSLTVTQYNSNDETIGEATEITGSDQIYHSTSDIFLSKSCVKITIVCTPASATYNTYVDDVVINVTTSSTTYSGYTTIVTSVAVGSAGYTTYVTNHDVSFPSGVTGYIATANTSSTVTLTSKESVPAGTPIVIKAAEGTYTLTKIDTTPESVTGNLLQPSDGSVVADGSTIYALGVGKTGANEGKIGFYLVNDGVTIPAGKAYLEIGGGGVKEFLTFDFGDNADGISEIENRKLKVEEEEAIYNLAGQRISRMQKGINIVNGKKVLY